jgi:hypothetical protein
MYNYYISLKNTKQDWAETKTSKRASGREMGTGTV